MFETIILPVPQSGSFPIGHASEFPPETKKRAAQYKSQSVLSSLQKALMVQATL
jgi:hypothetical protein